MNKMILRAGVSGLAINQAAATPTELAVNRADVAFVAWREGVKQRLKANAERLEAMVAEAEALPND